MIHLRYAPMHLCIAHARACLGEFHLQSPASVSAREKLGQYDAMRANYRSTEGDKLMT